MAWIQIICVNDSFKFGLPYFALYFARIVISAALAASVADRSLKIDVRVQYLTLIRQETKV